MSMWFNAKGKAYARTGPNAWIRAYVDHLANNLKEALSLETAARQSTDEKVAAEIQNREAADLEIVQEMRSLNIKNGSGEKSLQGGTDCVAEGKNSVALGLGTQSKQAELLVHGRYNESVTDGDYLHVVGNGSSTDARANAYTLDGEGNGWFSGQVTVGKEREALVTQTQVKAATQAIANVAGREVQVSENKTAVAKEGATVVGNIQNRSYDVDDYCMGNVATGTYALATGSGTLATGDRATAMGNGCEAYGTSSFAAGELVVAQGDRAMALGMESSASGEASVALGRWAVADGTDSLAALGGVVAEGASHGVAIGQNTYATAPNQVVFGKFSKDEPEENHLFVLGNGSAQNASNAFTVNESGDGWFKGEVFVGAEKTGLATCAYVDEKVRQLEETLNTMLASQTNQTNNDTV